MGDATPQTLIDAFLFLCGMNLALRSGQEHHNLQVTQIQLIEAPNAAPYLIYTIQYCSISKNNAGFLSHRKVQPKCVVHHANVNNPQCCLVELYTKYMEHLQETITTAQTSEKAKEQCLVYKNVYWP